MIVKNKKYNFNYCYEVLDNGLKVFLVEKPNYTKVEGIFTTKYGGVDVTFKKVNSDEVIKTPEGIAHFLEHMTFHMDETKDAAVEFEKLGAQANAFTTKTQTCYYFNTLINVDECINLLLDFVQNPYFGDKCIESERNIIEQEINMVNDDIDNQLSQLMVDNLIHNSSFADEIGGTVESIKTITKEDLSNCYETFYHPSNMSLIILGGINIEHTLNLIKENQSKKTFRKIESNYKIVFKDTDKEVTNHFVKDYKDVKLPKSLIGFRLTIDKEDKLEYLKKTKALLFLLRYYFSYGGKFYNELDKMNLANDTLSFYLSFFIKDMYVEFSISHSDIDKFNDYFIPLVKKMKEDKIDPDKFLSIKKKSYASLIFGLDRLSTVKDIAKTFIKFQLDPDDFIQIYKDITVEDLEAAKDFINYDDFVCATYYPKAKLH